MNTTQHTPGPWHAETGIRRSNVYSPANVNVAHLRNGPRTVNETPN